MFWFVWTFSDNTYIHHKACSFEEAYEITRKYRATLGPFVKFHYRGVCREFTVE